MVYNLENKDPNAVFRNCGLEVWELRRRLWKENKQMQQNDSHSSLYLTLQSRERSNLRKYGIGLFRLNHLPFEFSSPLTLTELVRIYSKFWKKDIALR